MKRVLKYPLQFAGKQLILTARAPQALTLQLQHNVPTLWVLVDADDELHTSREVLLVGTGWVAPLTDQHAYLGTVQDSGLLVWHFFWNKDPQ